MNIDPSFSTESFIEYLKTLDSKKQKRMMFMIEANLTIFDNYDYYTDFLTYPNYQYFGTDKFLWTNFYSSYQKFIFSLSNDVFNKPDDFMRDRWNSLKDRFFYELNFDDGIYEHEYDLFKFGLKLKQLRHSRSIPKTEFSKLSGLTIKKITQVEDYCFLSKIAEINQYILKGLEMNLKLNIK